MNEQKVQKNEYLEKVKLFTDFKDEKVQSYITLIFTFASFIFFGLFAINPTLGTIATLRRELQDAQTVNDNLDTKINSLSTLQQLYGTIKADIPVLLSAIPQIPEAPRFLAQAQRIAEDAGISLSVLSAGETALKGSGNATDNPISYTFEISGKGSEEQLRTFYTNLSKIIRITTYDVITLTYVAEDKNYELSIKGKVYFKP